ncbi:MAG TPA: signal peptide peptidase SppA [Dehalococcoidia bacterium]|jgi:protease-4|nr:signal peptide peptidase SppA [Dehalococcoidia bacterium]
MFVMSLKARTQSVAVVEMEGAIGQRLKANEYVKLFRSLEENDHIRAVVLDIDSPGGSATGSNYLYLGVKSLAKQKPVVAFIRGLGASGAYMLACPATRIVAIPSAIIGSIGVISMRPLVYQALDRIGVEMTVTKSDRLKDMGSMFREPTEEEKQKEQALVDDLYDQFLDAVAEGRGMDKDRVREVATGEVYTARKCTDLGLVDELGDLERAIDIAAELGNAPRRPVWLKPRRALREVLASMAGSSSVGSIVDQLEERLTSRFDIQHRL